MLISHTFFNPNSLNYMCGGINMMKYVYMESSGEKVVEYTKNLTRANEELIISFQFNRTINQTKLNDNTLSTVKDKGFIETESQM